MPNGDNGGVDGVCRDTVRFIDGVQKLGECLCDGENTGEFDKATATGMTVIVYIGYIFGYECYFDCLKRTWFFLVYI